MAFTLALGVTPESLKTKSTDINGDIDEMSKFVTAIAEEVSGTAAYWEGEAGTQQRKQFEEEVNEINTLITRLRTYPSRILQMAGIYEEAEESNANLASTLSPDIVMQ